MFLCGWSVQQKTLANELFSKKHSDCTEHVGICFQYMECAYTNETHMPITIFLSMVWYCSIKTTIFKAGLRQTSETECARPLHGVRQPYVPYTTVLTLWNFVETLSVHRILYCLLSTHFRWHLMKSMKIRNFRMIFICNCEAEYSIEHFNWLEFSVIDFGHNNFRCENVIRFLLRVFIVLAGIGRLHRIFGSWLSCEPYRFCSANISNIESRI